MGIAIMRSTTLWEPRKAFCCFKITTGGLIIGWFNLIASIITSISLLTMALVRRDHLAQTSESFAHMVLAIGAISFFMSIVGLISSILLLVGVSEDRPTFMMPFIVMRIVTAVISSITGVGLFIYWLVMLSTFGAFIMLNLFTILTLLIVYEILIVRACRKKVQQEGPRCQFSTDQQNAYLVLEQEKNQD